MHRIWTTHRRLNEMLLESLLYILADAPWPAYNNYYIFMYDKIVFVCICDVIDANHCPKVVNLPKKQPKSVILYFEQIFHSCLMEPRNKWRVRLL